MNAVEQAIRLLRERPAAAAAFIPATPTQIIDRARALGIPIHGEQGGSL